MCERCGSRTRRCKTTAVTAAGWATGSCFRSGSVMVQGFGGDWRRKQWLQGGGMQRLMMAEKPQTTRGRGDTVRVPPNLMGAAMWRLSRLLRVVTFSSNDNTDLKPARA
ncbi:hypothetical protein Hanom_Chr13g01199261 [Helianthus anomalus]